mgnify:CR=1 FL=1
MEAVLNFHHKEISLDPPGHTDILFYASTQTEKKSLDNINLKEEHAYGNADSRKL